MRRTFKTRKLLVASVGVAALTYSACSQEHIFGNLMGPPSCTTDADCVDAGRGPYYNSCGPTGYCTNVSPPEDAGQSCDLPACVPALEAGAGSEGGDAESDGSIAAADAAADAKADAGADAANESGDAATDAASE